jgi:hypothetical protein
MPGLIENQLGTGNQAVYTADTEAYDPTLREVNAPTETVAGQLHQLLSSGNPYVERAKSGAMQTANRRGLLNSSMAAGAGEAAAIDAALPIASADANVYGTASRENQGYTNTAGQFNAGAKNTASLQGAQSANQLGTIAATGEQERQTQVLKGTQATQLAEIEQRYKNTTQASASATALFSQVSKNISDILNDPNTSQEQKQAAVDHQTNILEMQLIIIGQLAELDLAGLLDFSAFPTVPGEPEPEPPAIPNQNRDDDNSDSDAGSSGPGGGGEE